MEIFEAFKILFEYGALGVLSAVFIILYLKERKTNKDLVKVYTEEVASLNQNHNLERDEFDAKYDTLYKAYIEDIKDIVKSMSDLSKTLEIVGVKHNEKLKYIEDSIKDVINKLDSHITNMSNK